MAALLRALLALTVLLGASRPCSARRPQADSVVAPLSVSLGLAPPPAPEAPPAAIPPSLIQEQSETRVQGWLRQAARQAAMRMIAVTEKKDTPETAKPKDTPETAKSKDTPETTKPQAEASEAGPAPTEPTEAPNATESGLSIDHEAEIMEFLVTLPMEEFTADHWRKMLKAKMKENPTLPATCNKLQYDGMIRQLNSCMESKIGSKSGSDVVEHGKYYWCECTHHEVQVPKGCEDVPLNPAPGVEITGCAQYVDLLQKLLIVHIISEVIHGVIFLVATYLCYKWHNAALASENMAPYCGIRSFCCCLCCTAFVCCCPIDLMPKPPKTDA